ncbi:MAG: outer membrane beta-barrel protein [Hyphomonadaceae bacterium]|nr:outer membrane beta-barrel protein [Hyphomonadaceae bacterium]MCA8885954.1 outer membrane beta-barrel protein [Hyphomonadaceae bacterium]
MRINPFASLFAASLIVLAPVHAAAQTQQGQNTGREDSVSVRDRDRPEYDAPGRRLGAFNLNASLDLAITSTDNLFAAPDGAPSDVSDLIYAVSPTVALSSDWSRHALAFDAGATFLSHEDFSNEDADTHYIRATGRFDIDQNTSIHGSARSSHEVSPRTDPDSPFVGDPVEYDRMDTGIGITHRFARFTASLDASNSNYDYDGVQSFRDNDESALRGRIEAELSPRVGVLLSATVDERDYDNAPQFDSDGQAYMVGLSLNTDLMRGEISVGHFERDYAGVAGTFDGVAVEGNVEWYVTQLTTVTLTARRDADDQIGAFSGEPYITEEYGLRVDHELLRNVILTGAARFGSRDYETIPRNDDYNEWELGADYMLNRNAAVRFRYEHDEVDSPAYRDYEVNQATLGLTLRL